MFKFFRKKESQEPKIKKQIVVIGIMNASGAKGQTKIERQFWAECREFSEEEIMADLFRMRFIKLKDGTWMNGNNITFANILSNTIQDVE